MCLLKIELSNSHLKVRSISFAVFQKYTPLSQTIHVWWYYVLLPILAETFIHKKITILVLKLGSLLHWWARCPTSLQQMHLFYPNTWAFSSSTTSSFIWCFYRLHPMAVLPFLPQHHQIWLLTQYSYWWYLQLQLKFLSS